MSLFKKIFGRKKVRPATIERYRRIVTQTRLPAFYTDFGVPDTPEGRFDLLALHAFLVMDRLSQTAPAEAQELFDLMFDDMEVNLRELGASDIRIGAKVKKLAQDFFGRSHAYRMALKAGDRAALTDALDRNLFAKSASNPRHLAAIADYAAQAFGRDETGEAHFPIPPSPEVPS